jgi:hypothetical protein
MVTEFPVGFLLVICSFLFPTAELRENTQNILRNVCYWSNSSVHIASDIDASNRQQDTKKTLLLRHVFVHRLMTGFQGLNVCAKMRKYGLIIRL